LVAGGYVQSKEDPALAKGLRRRLDCFPVLISPDVQEGLMIAALVEVGLAVRSLVSMSDDVFDETMNLLEEVTARQKALRESVNAEPDRATGTTDADSSVTATGRLSEKDADMAFSVLTICTVPRTPTQHTEASDSTGGSSHAANP
jgi:hypothetical protein